MWVEVRDAQTRELVATTVGEPIGFGAVGGPAALGPRHQSGWGNETATLEARAQFDLDGALEGGREYEVLVHYSSIGDDVPGCKTHLLVRQTMETWAPG